jgi:hypothetical protein
MPPNAFRITRDDGMDLTLDAGSPADAALWLTAMQDMRDTYAPLEVEAAGAGDAGGADTSPVAVSMAAAAVLNAMSRVGHSLYALRTVPLTAAEDDTFTADVERLVEDLAAGKATGSVPPSPDVGRHPVGGPTAPATLSKFASVESVSSLASVATHVTVGDFRHTILYPSRGERSEHGWSALKEEEMRQFQLVEEEPDGRRADTVVRSRFLQDANNRTVYQVVSDGVADRFIITAAPLEQLVARLADEELPDARFIDLFLLGYRHVTTAADLINRLLRRFNLVPPPGATAEENDYYARWAGIIQLRTFSVVKRWVDVYYEDFARDDGARAALDTLLSTVPAGNEALATLASRVRRLLQEREAQYQLWRAPPPGASVLGRGKPTTEFLNVEPREFARQVALLDHERFCAIHTSEFAVRLWQGIGPSNRHITEMIDWFNELSLFVASTVPWDNVGGLTVARRGLLTTAFGWGGEGAPDLSPRAHKEARGHHPKVYPRHGRDACA